MIWWWVLFVRKLEQIVLVAVVEAWKCHVWPSKTKLFRCAEAIDILPCEAEKLYCEEIDLGEEKPRQVRDRVDRVLMLCSFCAWSTSAPSVPHEKFMKLQWFAKFRKASWNLFTKECWAVLIAEIAKQNCQRRSQFTHIGPLCRLHLGSVRI